MPDNQEINVKIGADQSAVSGGLDAVVAKVKSAVAAMISSLAGLGSASAANSEKVIKHNADTALSFDTLKAKVAEAHTQMEAGLNKVNVAITAFLGILAGGGALGHFIAESNELTASISKLGKMFGINSDQATTFSVALHSVGLTNEQAEAAFRKFEIQVKRNSDGLQKLGVDTVGIKNGTLNTMEGFLQAIQVVGRYKEGHDQLQVAMQILGTRGMADIQKFLRLTKERMEEAEKEQRSLGLTVTEESRAMARAYNENMAGVHLVFEAIGKVIAEALMPRLIALAHWFREVGPTAVQIARDVMATFGAVMGTIKTIAVALWDTLVSVFKSIASVIGAVFGVSGEGITAMQFFRNTLAVVQIALIWFRVVFLEVFNAIEGVIEGVMLYLKRFAEGARLALRGDFSGAVSAWVKFGSDVVASVKKHMAEAVKIASEGAADVRKAVEATQEPAGGGPKGTIIQPKGGLSAPDFGKHKKEHDDRLALWRDELQQKQDAQGPFYENAKRDELKFWQEKLAIVEAGMAQELAKTGAYSKESVKLHRAIFHMIVNDKKTIAHEELDIALKRMQDEITAEHLHKDKQLELAHNRTEAIKALRGVESKQYLEMLEKETKLREDWAKKDLAILQLLEDRKMMIAKHGLGMQQLDLDQKLALGQISAKQRFAAEEAFEAKVYAMEVEYLNKRIALAGDDLHAVEVLNTKKIALEEQFETKITSIRNKAQLDQEQYALQANQSIQNSFATLLDDLTSRTKTFKQAMLDMVKSITSELTKLASQQVAKQLFGGGTQGGSMLSSITSKIFGGGIGGTPAAAGGGGGAAGVAGAAAGAAGKGADTAAETAHTAATTADTTATTALTTAVVAQSTATSALTASTSAQSTINSALATISATLQTAFSLLVAGANAAAAALQAVAASNAMGGGGGGGMGGGLSSLFGGGIPSFDVGTAYVPNTSLAIVHKGEKIIPAKYNSGGGSEGNKINSSVNHFNFQINGPADTRTMDQIQRAVARGTRRAEGRG